MNLLPDTIDFETYEIQTDAQAKVLPVEDEVRALVADFGKPREAQRGDYLPWDAAASCMRLRTGEVTLWAGQGGQGKSLITGQVGVSLLSQSVRCAVASFEMPIRQTLERMIDQWSGCDLDAQPLTTRRDMGEQFAIATRSLLWHYKHLGSVKPEAVRGVARYCAHELSIRHLFVDSLMKVVTDRRDFDAQANFVDTLCTIARDTGLHIHLIAHTKKRPDGSNDWTPPTSADIYGSQGVFDLVDNVMLFWRNRAREAAKLQATLESERRGGWREYLPGKIPQDQRRDVPNCDALLIVEKQRHHAWEGRFMLDFVADAQQYVEAGQTRALALHTFPHRPA